MPPGAPWSFCARKNRRYRNVGLHIPEIGAENPNPGMHYWKAFASFTSSESGDAAAPMTIRAKLLLFTAIDVKHR